MRIAMLSVFVAVCLAGVVSAQDRLTKVRSDRQNVIDDGYWIYNDLPAAIDAARKSGKPILVVVRCIPCEHCAGLDQDVVKPDPQTKRLMDQFVRVRLVQANGLDLAQFQYDFDLSFSTIVMNADGTIYARYGNRSAVEDVEDNPIEGFRETLAAALDLHRQRDQWSEALQGKKAQLTLFDRPEKYPALSRYKTTLDFSGKVVQDCMHCHQIRDAERQWHRERSGTIPDEVLFPWPRPEVVGLRLDPATKATVKAVEPNSAAAKAGFQRGDEILTMAGQPILSLADVQWVLEVSDRGIGGRSAADGPPAARPNHTAAVTKGPVEIPVEVRRGGRNQSLLLRLAPGWRHAQDISWRPTSWELRAMTLGGLLLEELDGAERKKLNLADSALALRVKHAGQYDKHAAAHRAGFRKDDVIIKFDGITQRRTESQLMAHGAQQHKPGDKLAVTVLRQGKPLELTLPMQ
jgi:hypothetical protein